MSPTFVSGEPATFLSITTYIILLAVPLLLIHKSIENKELWKRRPWVNIIIILIGLFLIYIEPILEIISQLTLEMNYEELSDEEILNLLDS